MYGGRARLVNRRLAVSVGSSIVYAGRAHWDRPGATVTFRVRLFPLRRTKA
jgi:hypothetical protein